jgi:histidinol-phosphatase (PHP family)
MYHNFHTHSHFCDGSHHPEEYVRSALKAGFLSLGFSSHAPIPINNGYAIQNQQELENYCKIVRKLKKDYQNQIKIFLSLEMDFINGISSDFLDLKTACNLDYTIGSVHLVRNGEPNDLWFIDGPKIESYDNGLLKLFGNDIRKAVTAYWQQVMQMILTQKPDIVGHLDKIKMHNNDRYFREDETWYSNLWRETLRIIKQSGTIVEINTRGIYKKRSRELFPGTEILKEIRAMNIPVVLNSDAHKPEEINGCFDETMTLLKELGYKELWYYDETGWKEQAI